MRKRAGVFLLVIIFIAFLLRFYQLGQNPPSLTWDETAHGYNAYSLLKTGRDEYQRKWPLDYLESFGDFKPVVYTYATILPVKIFGLNEFSTRFPSAFFGVLSVLITYFLVKELFRGSKTSFSTSHLPLFASLFLAISPWHLQLSRAAFEANLATFFIMAGVWLFLLGMKDKPWCLSFSAISFILSFYTFNSARAFVPLLILGLAIFNWRKLWPRKKWIIMALFVGFLTFLPLLPHLFSPQAKLRFREVNIFSSLTPIEVSNLRMAVDKNAWWSRIIHNRRLAFSLEYLKHYFDHFDPNFLFISGDGNPKLSIQDVGELYLFDLPFFLLGIYWLIIKKEKAAALLLYWLLLAPIPAATARETPHALRIETSLPTWQIISAYGFLGVYEAFKRPLLKKLFLIFSLLFLIFSFTFYIHTYYAHYPKEFSGEWQYGYKEAINYISSVEKEYDLVVFTPSLGRPYIYFLFYEKYPPEKFWQSKNQIERSVFGFVNVKGFDKYEFRGINWEEEPKNKKVLYVTSIRDTPGGVNKLKTIRLLNGQPVLEIFTRG